MHLILSVYHISAITRERDVILVGKELCWNTEIMSTVIPTAEKKYFSLFVITASNQDRADAMLMEQKK